MNKADLIAIVAERAGLTKAAAQDAVNATLAAVKDELAKGGKVALPGFGSFEVRSRAARTGRNPQTGAEIEIAASKVPAFKPGKTLRMVVNEAV